MLKGKKKFLWTPDCEEAFRRIKTYLTLPPTLPVPEVGETVYIYLAATNTEIFSVLVRDNGKVHLRRMLGDAKTRYTKIEK